MADEPVTALAVAPRKPRKPRTINKEREKANKLIREAKTLQPGEGKCKASVRLRADMSKVAGPDNPYFLNEDGSVQTRPCKNRPITGGTVCVKHGGGASQVRKKAEKRLLAMVEPALIRLEALAQQEEHLPTALGAIRTVLERAGSKAIGPLAKETGDKEMRPIINIGIKVGGIDNPVVSVSMQPLKGADDDVAEGELLDDRDDEPDDA